MPAKLPSEDMPYLASSSQVCHFYKGQGGNHELLNRKLRLRLSKSVLLPQNKTLVVSYLDSRASTLYFHLHLLIRWHVCRLLTDLGFPAPSYVWKTAVISSDVSDQRGAEIKSLRLFLATGFSRSLWKEDAIQWAQIIRWINLISLNKHGGEQSS